MVQDMAEQANTALKDWVKAKESCMSEYSMRALLLLFLMS